MANILYANNAAGTLASPITAASTTLTLNAGQVAAFPSPTPPQVFYVTLTDAATQTLIEIVKVTAVSGNVFSIVRAQDGTSALSWNANDIVSQRAIRLEMQGWENAAEGLFNSANVPITPSTTLGIVGTTLGDNANSGAVGEYLTNTSSIAIVSAVPESVGSLNLTPGDWDVSATAEFLFSGGGSATLLLASISPTLNGINAAVGSTTQLQTTFVTVNQQIATPVYRVNISAGAAWYTTIQANFTVTTASVVTVMRARRVR